MEKADSVPVGRPRRDGGCRSASGSRRRRCGREESAADKELQELTASLRSAPAKADLWHTRGQLRLKSG